ncbi:MAG: TIGR04283 family arsenosugar biosynthesis glycosyltransferase [Deltaproteobacteria bacterium]|nr:TIGR04283 family arsenosugar biosynthesis glycosyltransferase [Deltaproteobacteria bacterium]
MSGGGADRGAVVLVVKPPRAGEVKTRLGAAFGDDAAAALAAAFLADTLATVRTLDAEVVVATTADALPGPIAPEAAGLRHMSQGDGDLGARLASIVQRTIADHPWILLIGADSPGMPRENYCSAIRALEGGAEAVLGHALDGGFWLLGLRRAPAGLFDGIPWSAPATGAAMAARLRALGLAVTTVAPWFDVDEPRDLAHLHQLIAAGRVEAPRTAEALWPVARPRPARLAAVVPALEEEARVGALARRLVADPAIDEVIVVDGGSADGTVAAAREAGAAVVVGPRGRARQMNAGAALAAADALVFVHADVTPPSDLGARVLDALSDRRNVGGAFVTWTSLEGAPSWLGPLVHLADVRSRVTRLPYGDQAMFARRRDFEAVGGFPDQPLMEDLELSLRLSRRGRLPRLRPPVEVSGRRLAAAPLRTTLIWNTFPTLYRRGVPPALLARLYRAVR